MNTFLATSEERRRQLCIQTGAKLNLAEVAVEGCSSQKLVVAAPGT